MAFFEWKDSYSVGVKEMDNQHKVLIDLINQLHTAMSSGKGSTVSGPIITEMVRYTKFHFGAEEQLMTKHGYPGLLSQKAEHLKFTNQAIDYQNQLNSGAVSLSISILNFLKDWLTTHILGTDQKYSDFFNKKGVA